MWDKLLCCINILMLGLHFGDLGRRPQSALLIVNSRKLFVKSLTKTPALLFALFVSRRLTFAFVCCRVHNLPDILLYAIILHTSHKNLPLSPIGIYLHL